LKKIFWKKYFWKKSQFFNFVFFKKSYLSLCTASPIDTYQILHDVSLQSWMWSHMRKILRLGIYRKFIMGRSLLIWCSSTTFSGQLTACLRDLARYFKTDPTETVARAPCFGLLENTSCVNWLDEKGTIGAPLELLSREIPPPCRAVAQCM
jgi:hypothetical protein